MKFRRNRAREHVDINLASLIDVVFVLLLFFVVTTTFTLKSIIEWYWPHSSAHLPTNVPSFVGSKDQ